MLLSNTHLAFLALASGILAADPFAVSFVPSPEWFGIDGNWSALNFQVGEPLQSVNVLVSTALSEFWVIQSGGCISREPLCGGARGGVFNTDNSRSWNPLGPWHLGLEHLRYGGNGDYGLDSVATLTLTGNGFLMDNVITAALNTTDYYNGFFGLGIAQGNFGGRVAESPLTQAVKTYGWIPSYSYGYTAGAYYKGSSGVPCSLTLGGYDENRFSSHNTQFVLRNATSPVALVRGISVSAQDSNDAPDHWDGDSQMLSNMSTSFEALVDSSTPYLWLPDRVCDQFAEALNLTYNATFDLYTVDNAQFSALRSNSFSFTFSLSSFDNHDDFGNPLQVPGVINITITSAAFAHVLRYPFMDETIGYGHPAIPYFPLRKNHNTTNTFIIGRAFLQESYIITRYDSGVFSLHQALFPDEPLKNVELKEIDQPGNSPYPPPPPQTQRNRGLTTAQMVGIAVGVVIFCAITLAAYFCYRRRKKRRIAAEEAGKDGTSSIVTDEPRTPIARILTRIIRRRRSSSTRPVSAHSVHSVHEVSGSSEQPTEVGADANHEVYELAAPAGPTELDAADDGNSTNGETELGTESTRNLSPYEAARRKIERQLQGPVPAYSPPENPRDQPGPEKSDQEVSPSPSYQGVQSVQGQTSPAYSPMTGDQTNSLPDNLPSPMSPRGDGTNRFPDLPSPMTMRAPPFPPPIITANNMASGNTVFPVSPNSPTSGPMSATRSDSSGPSPNSPSNSLVAPSPIGFQRTPIDPSKVICLGPLPENIPLPGHNSDPRLEDLDMRQVRLGGSAHETHQSVDTLGSNYTEVEEQQLAQETANNMSVSPASSQARHGPVSRSPVDNSPNPGQETSPESPQHQRIDAGSELVHVPQLAARRYSWEED